MSVAERIDRIAVNLERWRWLPEALGDHHVRVNIAGFRLDVFEHGESTLATRALSAALALVLAALWLAPGAVNAAGSFDAGRAAFSLRVGDELEIPYRVFAVFVVPGETLAIEVAAGADEPGFSLETEAGSAVASASSAWRWTAPATPGVAALEIRGPSDAIRLNAIVMHAADALSDGSLNGYRIGDYPAPLNGDPVYRSPDGYIEIGDAAADIELSPHFRLSQFPCKQAGGYPKYLVLREQLLLKLELLLEHVNAHGVDAETFTVMSGYRTPVYNRAIGNGEHSRHVFGGAADIFVDVSPADGIMDDLDRNGVFDYRDAQWLYARAEELFRAAPPTSLRGGMGVYARTSAHGPFLHVDARGRSARWGLVPQRAAQSAASPDKNSSARVAARQRAR